MNILQKLIDEAVRNSATIRADELKRIQRKLDAAERTLSGMGYYWDGGDYFHPPKAERLIPINAMVGDDEQALINVEVVDDTFHGIPRLKEEP